MAERRGLVFFDPEMADPRRAVTDKRYRQQVPRREKNARRERPPRKDSPHVMEHSTGFFSMRAEIVRPELGERLHLRRFGHSSLQDFEPRGLSPRSSAD